MTHLGADRGWRIGPDLRLEGASTGEGNGRSPPIVGAPEGAVPRSAGLPRRPSGARVGPDDEGPRPDRGRGPSSGSAQMYIAGSSHWLVASRFGKRTTAGMPVATAPDGTSLTTTEFAPICTSSPMRIGPSTRAPAPIVTRLPTVGCRFTCAIDRPP